MKKYKVVERNGVAEIKYFRLYKRLPYLTIVRNVLLFLVFFFFALFFIPILFILNPFLFKELPSIRDCLDELFWSEIDVFDTLEDAVERINEMEEKEKENIYWF